MEIQGHIIKESEIVGIGPLMVKASPDAIDRQVYNTKKLLYDIHLRERSIIIESNFLNVGYGDNTTDEEEKARQDWKDFSAEYHKVKLAVSELIKSIP
jgi:hypothetical protein